MNPKFAAKTFVWLYLRPRGHFCLVLLTLLISLITLLVRFLSCSLHLATFSERTHLLPIQRRSYAPVLVSNCEHRIPESLGRTFETNVRGVGVSFVSWTRNDTFDKYTVVLHVHEAVRLMSKFQRPATLLDVGANVGKVTFPVLAMKQVHSVIAVEPVSTNVNMLCMTANLNGWVGYPGFIILHAAMSDAEGDTVIYVPEGREDNAALSSEAATANVHKGKHREAVRTLVVDDVLRDGAFKPDLIKIDTQGHELHVLRGMRRYLASAEPKQVLVMAESDPKLMASSSVDPADIYDLMTVELGYSSYCNPVIEVVDNGLEVHGEVLSREMYPPGGCRDIFYFKHRR